MCRTLCDRAIETAMGRHLVLAGNLFGGTNLERNVVRITHAGERTQKKKKIQTHLHGGNALTGRKFEQIKNITKIWRNRLNLAKFKIVPNKN